jgi:hypothetical protein
MRAGAFLVAILAAFLLAACGGGGSVAPDVQAAAEDDLLFGVRRDAAVDCEPEREGLPAGALGAITCLPANELVTRFTLVRWESEERLLDAYFAALGEHGVERASGDCVTESAGEAAYWPGEDGTGLGVPARQGCFEVGTDMVVLVTLPPTVLAEVHGDAGQVDGLVQWSWLGSQDVPGSPTIWSEDGPINIEKG